MKRAIIKYALTANLDEYELNLAQKKREYLKGCKRWKYLWKNAQIS
jgi:hypothetical protein